MDPQTHWIDFVVSCLNDWKRAPLDIRLATRLAGVSPDAQPSWAGKGSSQRTPRRLIDRSGTKLG
jgi:hypothetical protein